MEPLAALAEALARPVVRPGHVAVDRGRDRCDDLAHVAPFLAVLG
jgi:hypothetical protein